MELNTEALEDTLHTTRWYVSTSEFLGLVAQSQCRHLLLKEVIADSLTISTGLCANNSSPGLSPVVLTDSENKHPLERGDSENRGQESGDRLPSLPSGFSV